MTAGSLTVGPDCREGKHRACDGRGFDLVADQVIDCACSCHRPEPVDVEIPVPTDAAPEYTPLDHEIRARTIAGGASVVRLRDGVPVSRAEEVAAAEFDRWLAAHDAAIRARRKTERNAAWVRLNAILDEHGDGPEYRAAWAEWERLA